MMMLLAKRLKENLLTHTLTEASVPNEDKHDNYSRRKSFLKRDKKISFEQTCMKQ